MTVSRRMALQAALAGASLPAVAAPRFGAGIEGQRRADLGDGTYRNPIVPGDHADPTILKDGADYWMTFSSFQSYPGAVIWHSQDLVNWAPVTAALTQPIGTVWAMDLVKHQGRYFIYIPVLQDNGTGIYVIHADDIRGPWSPPVDLKIPGCIDPGHVVGEDGRRYLFVNGGRRVRLTGDGLATDGPVEANAWTPWQYPKDWVVEMSAPEGPKLLRRGEWFYLISAVGGTAGPPTSHMVTVARSRSVHGPWEHCPHNPIVRTRSADEPWWSRGHASLVEGPAGDWWMVYHGYENGFRTLGRQALLEPIEWTADGWPRAKGGTLASPLSKPRGGKASPAGAALSDDFSRNRMGVQWSFHAPGPDELARLRWQDHSLLIRGKGQSLADCSPLTCSAGDRSYECSVELEISGDGQGGLALFYNERGHVGIAFSTTQMLTYGYGQEQTWMREALPSTSGTRSVHLQLTNRENVITWRYSHDGGRTWVQHPWQMEVSGLHHNVFGGFVSLRPALFSAGAGEVRARNFVYRGLTA
ncbi:family 43 glycosylhydrolase [Roseateles saccharophilus]|uniref:Xylan 1,4-beta-xylosidase n=1 Tax=Roseateles saccharophilus TaxID=304 RepID=A0A4V2VQW9_ROSSA|nr:family 43 glycosylhydrolase [Roseateles saccharophilus]MDG0833051.1 xylan 1,4-beta-xylosidase [Roseateles saccharophilus]TCU96249.1 xylan 1,4-beta-xylosidase [Roseateles saccharophilus]